ncbi:MAG: glycosyltransferase family 4 protein [Hyphomonadaceae bacterium]
MIAIDFLIACAVAFAASALACRLVIAAGVVDGPTMRHKAHGQPTPSSAGLAIGIGYAAGICALVYPPVREWNELVTQRAAGDAATAMISAFLFLGIGTIDDLWPIAARVKAGLFVAASLAPPLFSSMRPEVIALGTGISLELPFIVAVLGSALWVFTMVNTVNFMDGANGLAMGSTAIGLLFLGVVAYDAQRMQSAALCFCGAAAILGFIVWNFPGGRLFAGDSGALFAGALAAIASLLVVRTNQVSPFVPAIIFFPMLADVLLTLAWRASRKAELLIGHREHFYQIGLRAGMSHVEVALRYWQASALCGVIGFVAAVAGRGDWDYAPMIAGEAGRALDAALSFLPFLALIALMFAALKINARIRAFALARGFKD